jgi:hypothetical protein
MSRVIFDADEADNNTSFDARQWVEDQFPCKHYSVDIFWYEGWSFRSLLEQAYMAGKESISNPHPKEGDKNE